MDFEVTQTEFGDLIGISQQAVSDAMSRGVIAKGGTLREWLLSYCTHLREVAAGRGGNDNGLNLVNERARLAKEQADRVELQNAIARREYAPIAELETGLSDVLSQVSSMLATIPGKLKRNSDTLTQRDIDIVTSTIVETQNTIAGLQIDWFGDGSSMEEDG